MRGAIPLRLLHQLSVVFHAGAKQPLVNLRLLEHQHFILLVVARRSIEIICRGIDPSQSLSDAMIAKDIVEDNFGVQEVCTKDGIDGRKGTTKIFGHEV